MTRRVTVHFVRIISIVTWPTCDGDDAMTMHDNEHVCAKNKHKLESEEVFSEFLIWDSW